MPSPFPGMNPYLEQADAWVDFHNKFIHTLVEWINGHTGEEYYAKIEDQIYIHELPPELWRPLGRADVTVKRTDGPSTATQSVAALDAPARVQLVDAIDIVTLPYLEIHDRTHREVITIIELLSPSNKRSGADRDQYARKRLQLSQRNVNFVELDLLRGGPRHAFREKLPACDYYVMVYRAGQWPDAGIWTIQLRDPLPEIPIPLRAEDGDLRLDLQEHLHQVYDRGKSRAYIYNGQPDPPLSPTDSAWAAHFVPVRST